MPERPVGDFRNIALVGHAGAGKTTLAEALLFRAGVTSRLGSVTDGTSMLDYDEESKERKQSVESSVFHIEHAGKKLNVIDTPGMPDYAGQSIAALAGVETALIVVAANAGIGVNTRRMANLARDYGLARMIAVTRIDADQVDLEALLEALRENFGAGVHPINLPADGGKRVIDVLAAEEGKSDILDVAQCHTELVDCIVETDEKLMDTYMSGGKLPREQLEPVIEKAVASGHLIPVMFVNASGGVGVEELLDELEVFAPAPDLGKRRVLITGEGDQRVERAIDPDREKEFIGQVIKVTSDPKSNIKYSVVRVHGGVLKPDGQVFISGDRKGLRPGHIFKTNGAGHDEISQAGAGDLIALAKLDLKIGTVIFDKADEGAIAMPKFPTPMAALAIQPKSRGDIEKIGAALHRLAEEDPCFEYHRDAETGELVMQGLGDQHLAVARSKMKRYFKLEIDTKVPKIPYRETIAGSVKYVEYTHKKQTGGAGQFARVFIDMEPNERGRGYEFIDKIFGGVIDQAFRPSVDKGVRDQMTKGVIAGYPVVDVKVSLVDGKTHPVDSKDIAFQIAGRQVFKKAFVQCKPILLEPVVNIEVTAPAVNVGDITRDLSGKRGQIIGQDMLPGGQVCVRATIPLGEVSGYGSQLKSVTGGQGSFVMEFSHYDIVPPNVQQQIVAAHKPGAEEEE